MCLAFGHQKKVKLSWCMKKQNLGWARLRTSGKDVAESNAQGLHGDAHGSDNHLRETNKPFFSDHLITMAFKLKEIMSS